MTFLDRFFQLELRERKFKNTSILAYVNECDGYSLKFTLLSKYSPTVVVDSNAKIEKICYGNIYDLFINECRSAMLISTMDISYLLVHNN